MFSKGNYYLVLCMFYIIIYITCGFKFVESFSFEVESPRDFIRGRCSDKPIEEREKMAEIIMTGTVKRVMPDPIYGGMYEGEVEIVRLMKGKDRVKDAVNGVDPTSNRDLVTVEGFGDPHICHSDISTKDTRILLLNRGNNGALRLNSSIVRITLTNLDRVDNAIKDVPYQSPTQAPKSPCHNMFCPFHAVCIPTSDGKPMCHCQSGCGLTFKQVCGTDMNTYSNECELKHTSCMQQRRINKLHDGKCPIDPCSEITCTHPSVCKLDDSRKPVCKCEEFCSPDLNLVCGTDGQTYSSPCFLRREACKYGKNIEIDYSGECKENVSPNQDKSTTDANGQCRNLNCKHGYCVVDRQSIARCVCREKCEPWVRPVCGSDGRNYNNECEFHLYACRNNTDLFIQHPGACGDDQLCKQKTCNDYQVCLVRNGRAKCECPLCSEIFQPVCGSDEVSYTNECQLRQTNCKEGGGIDIAHKGLCEHDGCGTVRECKYYSICSGSAGNARCVCPDESSCTRSEAKVCGSDNHTYQNECLLRVQSCRSQTMIYVASIGDCGDCQCNKYGSFRTTCNPKTGQCECKPGVGGVKCNFCMPKYWGLALKDYDGCKPCNCNEYGSLRQDCDQNTGNCLCKEGVTGLQCDICPDGQIIQFDVCGMEEEYYEYRGTSCDKIVCYYGAYCVNEEGNARCKCDGLPCLQDDHRHSVTVCGDDGNTYRSECHMKFTSCKKQEQIEFIYKEPCGDTATRTTSGSMASRSRKTTRHIATVSDVTRRMSKSTERPRPGNRFDGKIMSICYDDSYCMASNSTCRKGICQCLSGFIPTLDNSHCSEVKTVVPMETMEDITPCHNNPCRNQGTCEIDEVLGYRCLCPLGKTGSICIQDVTIQVPAFSGKSYLELKATSKTNDDVIFEIGFNTINKDGIIMFASQNANGSGDFISLALNNGFLEFRYDLGSGMAYIRSTTELAPNRNHRIIANRYGKRGNLQVNDNLMIHGESLGSLVSLDLNGIYYVGNVPASVTQARGRMSVFMGLSGCVNTFQAGATASPHFYNLSYPKPVNSNILKGVDILKCGDNPCRSLPCQNGGSCMMVDKELYQCLCLPGFTGKECDVVLDPCLTANCRAGSTCRLNKNGGYECVCPENMEGEYCEYERLQKIFIPQFMGRSYIKMPMGDVGSNYLSIRIWFKTTKPNGVILFASQYPNGIGDYISVNIINRQIEFRFNMGGGTVVIKSSKKIELGKWHEVLVHKVDRLGTLLIDNNDKQRYTGEAQGRLTELNLSGTTLYLGGFDSKLRLPIDSAIEKNLTGVIQRIYINGHQYSNIMETVTDAVNIVEYIGTPCNVNPCLNGGICVPRLNEADCKCPTRYLGIRCEKRADSLDKDLPVLFDGSTYLQYPNEVTIKQTGQRRNRYEIKFRTSSDGLILFQNGRSNTLGDYLAIAIVNGRTEFSYNLGTQSEKNLHVIKSIKYVNDGQWHNILAFRDERVGTLQVDDEKPVLGSSNVGARQLDTNGMLWIGGKGELPLGLPDEYYSGFSGCIEEVFIDYKQLHLFDDRNGHSTSVIKFCSS